MVYEEAPQACLYLFKNFPILAILVKQTVQ